MTNNIYKENQNWKEKISNHHQLGGIELSVLDNGRGRGVRTAWFDTGTGLRFKVIPDRAMDIGEAFFNRYSLTWISHSGITPPNQAVNSGFRWLEGFGGGLMVTCGLSHIGDPEEDSYGKRGLHGKISHIPAEIESVIQPDLRQNRFKMSISGRMVESGVFGPGLELRRTISAELGVSAINIHDEVTNIGNQITPHMFLYHMNFGWPLVDAGTKLIWEGKMYPMDAKDPVFNSENDYKICRPPLDEHSGSGGSDAFIDIDQDEKGYCHCGISNSSIPLEVRMHFKKSHLPWVTNWQHWGRNEYITGLEPGTNPTIGQARAREEGTLIFLEPGEKREYDLELEVICQP